MISIIFLKYSFWIITILTFFKMKLNQFILDTYDIFIFEFKLVHTFNDIDGIIFT